MPTSARTGLPHGRVSSDLACPGGRAWKEGVGRTVGRLPYVSVSIGHSACSRLELNQGP